MARTTMPNDHSALKEVSHKKVHKTKIVGHTNIVNFHKIVKTQKTFKRPSVSSIVSLLLPKIINLKN